MKNEKKHLISEDTFQIAWHESLASTNAAILNAVHSLHPIPTQAEAQRAVGQIESIVRTKFAEHKNFKSLAGFDILKMDGVQWPAEISELKNSLERLKANLSVHYKQLPFDNGFAFVIYQNGSWQVDQPALTAWNEKFYVYADPLKFEIATTICEAMNRLEGLTLSEKINLYASPIAKYSAASQKFEIEPRFLR